MRKKHLSLLNCINLCLGRRVDDWNPVPARKLLECILEMEKQSDFEVDFNIMKILNNLENDFQICLLGILGYCRPQVCPYCQSIKKKSLTYWKIWCQQKKPVIALV